MKLGSLVALVFGVGFVAAACNPDSMTRELDNHLTALIRGGDAVSQVRLAPDVRYYLDTFDYNGVAPRRRTGAKVAKKIMSKSSPNAPRIVSSEKENVQRHQSLISAESTIKTLEETFKIYASCEFDGSCRIKDAYIAVRTADEDDMVEGAGDEAKDGVATDDGDQARDKQDQE